MQPSKTTWHEQLNSLKYRQGCGLFNIVKNDHCFTRKKKEHASSKGGKTMSESKSLPRPNIYKGEK
jgi:hypothetical protein